MAQVTEKFEVRNRWTNEVQFTAEIVVTPDMTRGWKLRLAVIWALANAVPCDNARLDGADFTGWTCPAGSTFVGSRFDGSRFDGSTFVGSRFDGSTFDGSTFDGSTFVGSTFVGSRFVDSTFVDSTFDGSTFVDSTFVDSTFDGSRFDGSTFDGSTFVDSTFVDSTFDGEDDARADFLAVIATAHAELPGLIAALREGRVDGSSYYGKCACLIGTVANLRGVDANTLPQDSGRPAEKWFLMISVGDRPGDASPGGYAAQRALEWALGYCEAQGIDPDAAPVEAA